jgi:hypothetical protein
VDLFDAGCQRRPTSRKLLSAKPLSNGNEKTILQKKVLIPARPVFLA